MAVIKWVPCRVCSAFIACAVYLLVVPPLAACTPLHDCKQEACTRTALMAWSPSNGLRRVVESPVAGALVYTLEWGSERGASILAWGLTGAVSATPDPML